MFYIDNCFILQLGTMFLGGIIKEWQYFSEKNYSV